MAKVMFLLTLFGFSTWWVMYMKHREAPIICSRCGIEGIDQTTLDKRKVRKVPAEHLKLCVDCIPRKPRKRSISGHEVWEAYKKEMGIK